MANIKISELNELTQKENNDFLPIVDSSANETKKISVGNLTPGNDKLVHVGTSVDEAYRTNIIKSKNLLSASLELGTFTNSGVKDVSTTNYRTAEMIKVKPNTTYTLSIDGVEQKYVMYYYNINKNFLSMGDALNGTFTTPANCEYVNFRSFNADFTSDFANLKIQIEEGSTATTYAHYACSINVDNEEIYSKPTVLFNQKVASATTSLSLSDAYTNYKYLEIYGRTTNNGTFYKKVDTSNTIFTIDISTPITGSLTIQEYVNLYSMSGNKITCTRYLRNNYANGSANVVSETNGIFIDKVIGYK